MVSFKNESIQEKIESRRKSQTSSIEMIIIFLILLLVVGGFGVMKYWKMELNKEISSRDTQIKAYQNEMQSLMVGEKADFYKRSDLVEKSIYKKHSSVAVLSEVEKVVVPRVVLLSFIHTVEKSGAENITITADADEYYLMAQQIQKFKESKFFSNIRESNTSRNNVGRIVFTIKADIVDKDNLVFFPNKVNEETSSTSSSTNNEANSVENVNSENTNNTSNSTNQ